MSARKRFAAIGLSATMLSGVGVALTATDAAAATYACNYTRTTNPYRTYAGHYSGSTHIPTKGSWSKANIEAQCLLKKDGWNPGPIDGIYGDQTLSAVMYMQARYGIGIDGYMGPESWPILRYFA
ncbi:peptidoglycan-binding domain-containing protein [Yinghuangia soli]|uniref:Peptidoglycan-binding protein n=1 Tax=Yinghuangia soli TaxID=2908204 RepID=A0AA41Q0C4_9ACTN|nr:peptidoglycan-binding domain-containing protein [Yinghuangia soli]MCF2528892.1 peptidoglycan-binding protein [Yinghuangia soli]